ncbi:alginate lyase family protein [Phragmitibacter flavus]|nr:alginate lyase family protein [Phragmitibacter flavus]
MRLTVMMLGLVLVVMRMGGEDLRAQEPGTFSISPKVLMESARRLKEGDESLKPALKALVSEAERGLKAKTESVMGKEERAASGDPHDYFSIGVYWWPDPKKPDGLPWIRRDGVRNPGAREDNDASRFSRVNKWVETLGLAYYFTREEKYAAKAAEFLRVWYLNEGTRMNPHMNYAQAVPGRNDGRSTGLIEAESMMGMLDGVAMIRGSEAWTLDDGESLSGWLEQFYQWLRTSDSGLEYEKAENNHGVYHDVIATHLALYLGMKEEAEARSRAGLTRRLDAQIEADGTQPLELARTLSWSYSVFNLSAFMQLARMGESVGVDWWGHRGPKGQSLRGALDLLVPYLAEEKEWKLGKQIKKMDRKEVLPLMMRALDYEEIESYRNALEQHGTDKRERWWLAR